MPRSCFWDRYEELTRQVFATSAFPIMHLVSPPKILHKYCFQFLLGRLQYPGEMKNKDYAEFGGGGGGKIRCIMGNVEVAYWPFFPSPQ